MRLIDADELKKIVDVRRTIEAIDNAPTIETPVVEVKIDTDALIERIKKEYDIVE